MALMQRGDERVFHLRKDGLTGRTSFFKRIQSCVIPMKHHRQCAVFQIGHVYLDGFRLADAIQPADALFQQIGIQR